MKPWQVLSSRVLIERLPWLRVIEQNVRLPGGHIIEGYLLANTREYSMVFAQTEDGRVPLVQQYKHGPRKPVYDLPAGYLNGGENPLSAAQHELLEETGYAADEWQPLASTLLDPNRSAECAHLYLACGACQVAAPRLDETEDLVMRLYAPGQLLAMIRSGEIDNMATVACILLALDVLNGR